MSVHVHIERLVLEGFPLDEAAALAVQGAVEAELSRLLGEGGVDPELERGGSFAVRRGGPLMHPATHSTKTLGSAIGQAVYAGICP